MVRFGAPSPKAFIEKLAANDAATTSVDLTNNALFKMKSFEYLGLIADAMAKNTVARAPRPSALTYASGGGERDRGPTPPRARPSARPCVERSAPSQCTELILKSNDITNADCEHVKRILLENATLTTLNLEGNKIDHVGCSLIAEGIKGNKTLTTLVLLGNGTFGESCMDAWLAAFEDNITLVSVKWRLDSRKSFKLNKDITRNNSILRWKNEGKDWESLLPDHLKPERPAAAAGAAAAAQEGNAMEDKIKSSPTKAAP